MLSRAEDLARLSTRSDKRHLPEDLTEPPETLKRRATDQVFCNEELTDDRDEEQHCDGTHGASLMTAAIRGMLVDPSEVKPSTTRSKTSPAATMHEEDPNTDEICVTFLGKEEQGELPRCRLPP